MRRSICLVLAAGGGLVAGYSGASIARADAVMDTRPAWILTNSDPAVEPFGTPEFQTFGETIVAPTDGNSDLEWFSFNMYLPTTLTFRGEVYAWDGSKATGSAALWESTPMKSPVNGGFAEVRFYTPGIQLAPGQQYVLFASTSKDSNPSDTYGRWGFLLGQSPIAGSKFVYENSGTDTAQWTNQSWQADTPGTLAFTADFSAPVGGAVAPLPSAGWGGLLLLGGLAGARIFRRRVA